MRGHRFSPFYAGGCLLMPYESAFLGQADSGNVLGSTLNERKQMSTKTTLKRVALVAVSALGLGLMSVVPASATTTGFSLSRSSITVVGADSGAAVFRIQLSNAAGTTNQSLQSDETLTVSVIGVPTGVTASKTVATAGAWASGDLAIEEGTVSSAGLPYSTWDDAGGNADADGVFAPSTAAAADSLASGALSRSYYARVTKGQGTPWDQGTYTLRFRLVKGNLLVQDTTARVTFVTSAVDSGAALTLTDTGTFTSGVAFDTYSASQNIRAVLTDANGGQIINSDGTAPELTGDVVSSTGTTALASSGTVTFVDGGLASDFGYAAATTTADPRNLAVNGTYGATWTPGSGAVGETNRLRVRYGAASAFATVAVYAAASGTNADSTVTTSGTGIMAGSSAGAWTLPLGTKSAVITVTVKSGSTTPVQDYPVTFTTTWTGVAAGDQTPLSGTDGITVVKTNSEGKATLTITNASPDDADSASVAISGALATGQNALTSQVITWAKSKPATVSSSPNANFTAAVGSRNTITWTFLDSFGAPVVGEIINLSMGGTGTNSAGTLTIPSAITDAKGQVSYSWTSTATNLLTDSLTATSNSVSGVSSTITATFRTTVPVIATLKGLYNTNEGTSGASSFPDLVGTAVISAADPLNINTNMDITKSLALSGDDSGQISFRFEAKDSAGAAVTGVPVTVKVSDGGHILSAAGLPVTERIIYPTSGNVDFVVTATTVGEKTVTVTAGTVTATAVVEFENAEADARTVAVKAGSKAGSYTATVTDRFGNAVSGVDLTIIVSGDGRLATGGKSVQWTTTASGSYDFDVVGAGPVAIQVSGAATSGQLSDIAGVVGTTVIAGVTAGVKTATLSAQTPAPDAAATAAESAADAAAEAIDAANAATDAANLAAEAADAATVAAEEARDAADAATAAVEELGTQVATLMAALRAQITTLANTVAKIAKKVRA
jgi:hypothetical protein